MSLFKAAREMTWRGHSLIQSLEALLPGGSWDESESKKAAELIEAAKNPRPIQEAA